VKQEGIKGRKDDVEQSEKGCLGVWSNGKRCKKERKVAHKGGKTTHEPRRELLDLIDGMVHSAKKKINRWGKKAKRKGVEVQELISDGF